METVDQMIDLRWVLPMLTGKQAEALGMWVEGYTQKEVGIVMGIGRTGAEGLIERGLACIRRAIEGVSERGIFCL